jgi:hypothetical protein
VPTVDLVAYQQDDGYVPLLGGSTNSRRRPARSALFASSVWPSWVTTCDGPKLTI